jgi:pimeloyl-ACP methyl ester carboxylesterase
VGDWYVGGDLQPAQRGRLAGGAVHGVDLVSTSTPALHQPDRGPLLEATRLHTDQPLVVAGDSLGGLIAFEFARSFPDETAGLVASGAPA